MSRCCILQYQKNITDIRSFDKIIQFKNITDLKFDSAADSYENTTDNHEFKVLNENVDSNAIIMI